MKIRAFRLPAWSVPLALLAVTLLSFGMLLPRLGFYWDDWNAILVNRVYGPEAFWRFYALDRPTSAWSYVVLAPILGSRPLAWQAFTLALRWLTAVGMFWTFQAVWPKARASLAGAAMLFLVYPVFSQQALSVTYHQLWLEFACYFLSLGAMVRAARAWQAGQKLRLVGWTALALLAFVVNFSISEYFIGVELLRPLLLWFVLADGGRSRLWRNLRRVLLHWLPYLLALAFFVYWRLFLVHIAGGDPNKLLANPLQMLVGLIQTALRDGLHVLVAGWYQTLQPALIDLQRGFLLFAWGIVVLVAAITAFFLLRLEAPAGEDANGVPARIPVGQIALVGLAAVLLGPAPAWITGRSLGVAPDPFSDRYAAVAMFGAALLLVAALHWLTPRRLQQALVLSALIGLGAGMQVRTLNDYRWFYVRQSRFYWQLAWRAPNLAPNTILFARNEIFPLQGRFATSVALNLAYPQQPQSTALRAWVYALEPNLKNALGALVEGRTLDDKFRIFPFQGNSRDALVIRYQPEDGSCLWVLHPQESYAPGIGETVQAVLPISDWSRILPRPEQPGYPPAEVFGPEPEHTWCYYYQKAGLALQQGDWSGVSLMEAQARAAGYAPGRSGADTPFEWLPFVEARARAGDWQAARELTLELSRTKRVSTVDTMLCQFWARLEREIPESAGKAETVSALQSALSCP